MFRISLSDNVMNTNLATRWTCRALKTLLTSITLITHTHTKNVSQTQSSKDQRPDLLINVRFNVLQSGLIAKKEHVFVYKQ